MGITRMEPLPQTLLDCEVERATGETVRVGEIVGGRATLLLFVRHFGCIGCSENIGTIAPRFRELDSLGVRVAIIGCGAARYIEGFTERYRLIGEPVEVFTDESLATQQSAQLNYGSWGGFGPRALYEMARAFVGGHVAGPVDGDTKQQAGAIFVDAEGIVRLYHRAESLGDHVDSLRLVESAIAVCVDANPELV